MVARKRVVIEPEPMLTIEQVAAKLQFSPSLVRRMCNDGELPAMLIGKVWRIEAKEFEAYLRRMQQATQEKVRENIMARGLREASGMRAAEATAQPAAANHG